ncbi:hypothetical protein LY76DRAFT_528564 [Colletotrichum caudatum]|nr:hypothetical protein LY76DRAFT_528564 [Colletotrichum caudatum]
MDGHNLHLIDTPGFDDTELKDTDILMQITKCLDPSIHLSGILYLYPFKANRMSGVAKRNLEMFWSLVGQDNMRNINLITTMWDRVSSEEGEKHLMELTRDFWNLMITAGTHVDRCYDASQDGNRIIQSILKTSPLKVQLQKEIEKGCRLSKTTAGELLMDKYGEVQKIFEAELREMRNMLASVTLNRDREAAIRSEYEEKLPKQDETSDQVRKLPEADIKKLQDDIKELKE